MKPEVKAKWLEALRSGHYKQTRGKLTSGRGFCCLGVLCDLHAKETSGKWGRDKESGMRSYLGESMELPMAVQEWAGLPDGNPMAGAHSLAAYNDGDGDELKRQKFEQIADVIEERL